MSTNVKAPLGRQVDTLAKRGITGVVPTRSRTMGQGSGAFMQSRLPEKNIRKVTLPIIQDYIVARERGAPS